MKKKKQYASGKKEIEKRGHATLLLLDGKTYYQLLLMAQRLDTTVQDYSVDAVREYVRIAVTEKLKKDKERKPIGKLSDDAEHTKQPSVQTLPSTIVEQTETR